MRKVVIYIESCAECPHNSDEFCELLDLQIGELSINAQQKIPNECPLDHSVCSFDPR